MHSIFKIGLSLLLVKFILAIENENQTASVSSAPVERQEENDRSFSTSHSISINGVPFPREGRGFYQTVRPDFDMELRQVIGDNVRNIIDSNEKLNSNQENLSSSKIDINDINLLGAGSEQKPKSRIVTKKGENGKEYEYEYYYYYEEDAAADDDEDTVDTNSEKSSNTDERSSGKQTFEKDTPLYSRNVTNVAENVDTSKRNSIRRPSLDLVDSHSFNTNDKKSAQASTKNGDTQLSLKESDDSNAKVISNSGDADTTSARPSALNSDTTAFIMEKSALDLYAMLANENLNSENEVFTLTTTDKADVTTELEYVPTTTTTTTTTTTPSPTTTQDTSSAKAAVSNVLPIRSRTRISGLSGKKKDSSSDSTTSQPTTEKAAPNKRRFSSASASKHSDSSDKKEEKNESNGSKKFGTGYNRFNLKSSVTRTTEEPKAETPSSTTRSVLGNRQRPGFGSRRGIQKVSSSNTPSTSEANVPSSEPTTEENVKSHSPINNKLKRVNLSGRRNPLLSRKREEVTPSENSEDNKESSTEAPIVEAPTSSLKQRGRLNINSYEKPSTPTVNVVNRRVNPLLRSRVTVSTSTEASEPTANKDNEKLDESDVQSATEEIKNETTVETPTPKPHGLAALRRKILLRQPANKA